MVESSKLCPICNTPNHPQAAVCVTCGTTLTDVEVIKTPLSRSKSRFEYDYRYGETDLFEGNLRQTGTAYLVGALVMVMVVALACLAAVLDPLLSRLWSENRALPTTSVVTLQPTQAFATVTPAPPTPSPTPTPQPTATPTLSPTPEPCIRKVVPGDDLTSLLFSCGHRHLDVMTEVLELNDLSDPSVLQVGQTLIIPWPTPTFDLNAPPTDNPIRSDDARKDGTPLMAEAAILDTNILSIDPFAPTATETLQPGVIWHRVQLGENIISIAVTYGADVEIMSQLNPEITFSQCDFGLPSGGGSCVVNLYEGQLIRVPAPTATPTFPPTPSGSETPTPTATPTYNAPSALSPTDRAFFQRDELVTLRWVTTGTLAPGQVYRVRVEEGTTGKAYTGDTHELFFIIPAEWQVRDGKPHEYRWTVSVIDTNDPGNPYFTTAPRAFTWQG